MSSNNVAVSVRNLSKSYAIARNAHRSTIREAIVDRLKNPFRRADQERFWALKDVDFDLERGEVLGVIGRNGAGKSTLLKILSEITEPTTGEINLYGRVGSLLEVGSGFHPELTGRENIFLNGAILGMSRQEIKRQFDAIVDFSGVEKFLDTPVKRYSSGMYVRLAFGVAAHLESEILIIDEVLAVGDAEFQRKCLGKMESAAKTEGRTVLFVSHNMKAVEQLCSSALLLKQGQVADFSKDVPKVIKGYFQTGSDSEGSSSWVNPGDQFDNPWFKPLRFFLADESGSEITEPIKNNTGCWLHVEAEVESIDLGLNVGYAAYAEDGQLFFRSFQTDVKYENWPRLHKGRNLLRTHIPAHFLNEGLYRIELLASPHQRFWILEPGVTAPFIHLEIQGGLSQSPHWVMKRPGILAPLFEWSNQQLPNEGE